MGLGGPWRMGQLGLWGLFRSHSEWQAIPSGVCNMSFYRPLVDPGGLFPLNIYHNLRIQGRIQSFQKESQNDSNRVFTTR